MLCVIGNKLKRNQIWKLYWMVHNIERLIGKGYGIG